LPQKSAACGNLFHLLEGEPGIVDVWEKLVGQYLVIGKQAHDAQPVAAMLVHGVRRLLTFNAQDFKRYPAVEVIVPDTVAIQQG
jgi:predicted nucleic acid-binding protein